MRTFWANIGVAVSTALCPVAASAHDWYPRECCGGQDCGPVISQRWVAGALYDSTGKAIASPAPEWEVTTKEGGSAIVPPDMPRLPSHDHQTHACIIHDVGGNYVMCIFVPPSM